MDRSEPKRRRRRKLWMTNSRWMCLVFCLFNVVEVCTAKNLVFTRQRYNATIYENNIGKSYATPESERMGIQLPEAAGTTVTDIRYRIIAGDKNKLFKAESRQVGDFSFLLLRTRTGQVDVLNRERTELHKLRIRAMLRSSIDGSDSDLPEAEADVWVYVQDTNDLSPLFYPSEYKVDVPEDAPLYSSLVQVKADDADVGVNGEIYYSLAEPSEQFAVHPLTGVVSLTRPLVFADQSSHELAILANDRGPQLGAAIVGAASRARVVVNVQRVNQHEPKIHVRHLPEVVEQSQVDVYAVVRVEDADQGPSGQIRSLDIISGDPDGYFRVQKVSSQPAEFNIAVLKLLDRERAPSGYNLTLRATDGGTPPRNSTATLHVTVADWNDHAPVFDRQHYEVRIVETAPVGTPLIRLRVTDEDQGRNAQVQLSIVGGNQGGHFRIHPKSGVLYTALPLDAEMRAEHVLTVSAIDQGTQGTRQQSSAKVTVQVLDANDNDPVFFQQPTGVLEVQVDENEQAGAEVARATARDADAGENAYISYSLANLAPVPFEVDPFTGAIRTTEMLDYETGRRRYLLKVRASDWGTPYRRQSELLVTVVVRDVNDNRPQFQRVGCTGRVPRTTSIGSELLTLSAVDFDQGNAVVYRIVSGNEDGCFSLDPTTGGLSVACDLSDLGISERYVNVTATDGQHFADIMSIKIHLTSSTGPRSDSNEVRFECRETGLDKRLMEMINLAAKRQTAGDDSDPSVTELPPLPSRYGQNVHTPEFYDFPVQVRVNESVASGTALIRIRARDRDHGYNGLLVFVISGGDDDSVFQIETETGLLRVVGQLDRERRAGYSLNLTVFDLGQPQRSAWRILPVIVTDVNDNPPRFDRPVISVSIAETAQIGTSVAQLSASDADEGDNAKITFSLAGSDTSDLKLDPISGLLTVAGQLDRERRDFYEVVVIARDGSSSEAGLSSKALVRVRILDVNDVPPKFARPWQVVKIREDVPVGAVVALVEATDPDLGLGGVVRYSLASSYASETVERFSIDRVTGMVRLAKRLDFEDRSIYNLTVRAKDRGSPSLSSEAYLAVEVVDVNENLFAPRFDDFVTEASVRENAPPGTLVGKVTATDADPPGDDSRLSYFIRSGTGLGLFSIDNEGTIRTRAVLDRETTSHYWLTVVAQDHGIVTLSSSIEVFVQVLDENDHIPLTTEPVYWVHVAENSPPKTPVARITAVDGDRNSKLTYQLKAGNPQSLFEIDPNSGNITTTGRRLDRENLTEHILEVMVIDNGNPVLSSSTRVVVTVDDVNDNAPEFLERFYKIQIPSTVVVHPDSVVLQNETEEWLDPESNTTGLWITSRLDNLSGSPVFRVEAFDRDVGDNGRIGYSLMETASTKGRFRIHPHSGVVYAQKSLSAGQEFSFSVRASDRGRPSRNATTRVSVTVIGVPPQSANPPELSTDNSRRADVMESDPVGHAVAFITANDPDGDMLWYKIEDGNTGDKFAMQTTGNGKVYVAQPLDWEQQSSYSLNISITDGHNTIYTQLEITVLDVNDHPPVFSELHYRAQVSENAEIGSEIVTLNATDADQDKRVFYAIHSAASASSLRKFKVDSVRGVVTLAEKLDRETMGQHLLTVSVKDQGTPSKRNFARLLIEVTDHNDHAPEFMSELIQVRIFETAAVGSVVTAMMAIDKDRGANAKISYSISSGNVGGAFGIEPDSGLIRVNQPLDVGTAHEYMLVVKATDGGSPSLSSSCRLHILVTMAENDPPKFLQNEYTADVFEDATGGTFVIQVEGRSISSLLFEISDGNGDGVFTINPSTGIIIVSPRGGLDYETVKHYNLSISAMNMAGSSARCRVLIHVLDVNDNSPAFSQELYEGTISESAAAGSLVFQRLSSNPLVVTAKDADAGVNALLSYDIVESRAAKLFAIDSNTGAVRTLAALDREQLARVEFTVQVSDHGRPKRNSDQSARVVIVITDVNDSPPKFTGQLPYTASLLLPTFTGVAVLRIRAEDPDSDVNSTLSYDITGGNGAGKFAIDRRTGWISVSNTDGLSSQNFYTLDVSVSDGKFKSSTKVEIQLEKMAASGLAFAQDKYTGYVTENSTRGATTVVTLNVLGTLLNEHVTFSILNPQGLFQVGSTSGVVQTIGQIPFDREVHPRYVIVVEARSERGDGEKPRIAHTRVEIEVTDINDNRPVFFNLPYYAVVSSEAPKSSVITKVQAMDKDVGENGDIRYELLRGSGELFRVDRRTGEILLRHTLEGQHHSDYELVVAAYDGGTPPLSSEALVRIKVVDKTQPVFGQQYYSASVAENADPLSPVLSVQASSPSGRQLIYSIVSGNEGEEFAVDFNTAHNSENGPCLIYIVNRLDYEVRSKYELLVRATDSVSGAHSEVPVSVNVDDANDSPPEFGYNEYNVTLSEATHTGTLVLAVSAHDLDSGNNAQVVYRLLPDVNGSQDVPSLVTASAEFFHINPEDGTLTLVRSLDRESQSQHHLLVMASDQGTPSLSSTAHIWIRVDDVNDNPPQFEQRSYRCVLSEDAKRGQFVTMVTATDPDLSDQNRLVYSLTGGNDQQMFNIDAKKGTITLGNLHRFGEQPNYLLNISVSDGVFTSFATLQVDLLSTNRHSPSFSRPLYEMELMENLPAGTLVIQLNATDADRDDFGRIAYSILSTTALEVFKIDEETGDVFTRRPLDRETRKLYEIPVIALDAGGKSGHATLRIKVADANDNRPKFLIAEYRANIHANYSVGQPILKVQAIDLDADNNAKISYSIYESNGTRASETFIINSSTGEIFLKQNALALANEVFQFFVRAEDHGSPVLGTEVPVDILILDPQERAPTFERTSSKYFISESAPVGTTIARVKAMGGGDQLHYTIVPSPKNPDAQDENRDDDEDVPSPFFSVDDQGQIYLSAPLDRETCDIHIITVVASTDTSPPIIAFTEVIIQVLDTNEHQPEFESNPYHVVVAENAEKGTSVIRVLALDGDRVTGTYGDLRYSFGHNMAAELANIFRLDSVTGWITTLGPLDREECDRYVLPIVASDNGTPAKLTSTTTVVIQVRDYNDNPPQFSQSHYVAAVNEEALPGTVVVRLTTTDKDRDQSRAESSLPGPQPSPLQYYITGGDPRSQFGIRQGEVYVERALDREEIGSYSLQVLATDGFFTATTHVTVDILDDNDHAPVCSQHRYQELVSESTSPGSFIVRVRATDADEGLNAKMKFYLTGEAAEFFYLDASSGQLKTAKPLDRETRPVYALTAHVQDRERPQWECTSEVVIVLMDVNDNAPSFNQDWYTFAVPEDAELRTIVGKVHATDSDLGLNRKIRYSFVTMSTSLVGQNSFAIDPDSGIITVAKGLDRETVASFNLTVSAIDLGTPALTSSVVVTVHVLDINDNPPQFSRKLYTASVAESASVGTEVLNVLATSLDVGVNAEMKYSIVGGNEHRHFAIDPITGSISLADPLDYERAREFYLTIQALDGGVPPLSNHAAVNITVLDSNDNPPVFTQSSYSAAIREDALIGETVLRVNAVDLDGGDNGRITYTLLNGDRHSQFRIDSSTGLLTVSGQLDRELITNYMLEIEARDNGAPSSLASNVLVALEILDANDNPPAFSQANYTAIAQEDKPLGFVILKFQVSDADGPSNAGPFTFEIRSGNVDNAFRIDGNGSLRTARRFNHKVRDQYTLQIVVFDNGSPPLYSDTWVTVKVIEESKYPPIITPLEININSFLDEYAGGIIGRVHVNDQDPYDTLVYSIVEEKGYHQHSSVALFELDSEDGTLIAKPGLDVGAYTVNVSVTDGKFFTYSGVKVNVVLISDEALQNSIILTIRDITADDFVTNYRKNFLKAVRNIMNVRTKDVFIISIQPQVTLGQTSKSNRTRRDETSPLRKTAAVTRLEPMWRIRDPARQSRPNVDILFAVQKPAGGFYPPAIVRKQLLDNVAELEATIDHHRISGTVQGFCTANFCGSNGKCYDRVVLDDTMTVAITSDIISFVAPRHKYKPTCLCKDGYGGEKCDVVANECARNPCPENRVCRPEAASPGYSCRCPENQPGCVNDLAKITPCKDSGCYQPSHPLFFSGKSYAQYSLGSSIERHLLLTLRFRTIHPAGSLMFATGRIDYSILEIVNGEVQYRFDCGSGEGLVRVTGTLVNDGVWHDIRLERHGSVAELTIDGSQRSQGAAPGVNDVLNLEPISDYVFFGAEVRLISGSQVQQSSDDIRMGFVGCLDDIRLNDYLLPRHISNNNSPSSSLNSLNSGLSTSNGQTVTLKRFTNVEFVCRVPLDRPGVCGTQPCLNGGTCVEVVGALSGYQCTCRPRFLGARCEIDSDPCASSPCLFNGRCYNLNNDYRCECPARLSGKRCEYGRYCNPNPCKNGGICEEGGTGPICKCRGFTGDTCSVDVNECEPSPCQNGGTCVNIVGSFQCLCPINVTGHYCTELALKTDLITSNLLVSLEEIIGFVVGVSGFILLVVLLVISCRWMRNKRLRGHRSRNLNDSNGKEMVPLNSTRPDLSDFKRGSKLSNLEVTNQVPPILPPRPASYTPSANEPTYIPLNNLDTIRSYGSAADELETYPMLGIPTYNGNGHAVGVGGHNNPDYHPNLNRPAGIAPNGVAGGLTGSLASPPLLLPSHDPLSDTDSVHKPRWSDLESNLKGSYYEAAKIHNDLKGKSSEMGSSTNRSHHHHHHLNGNHYGHSTGGLLLNNVKSTNKETTSSLGSAASPISAAAVDDCARGCRDGLSPLHAGTYNCSMSPLPTPPPSPPIIPPLPRDYAEFELSLQTLMRQTALLTRPSPSYHWDCSDWANQSQNPLPNITEVPGSEIPDSSSFHSNESNESNGNAHQHDQLTLHNGAAMMTISPERDLDTLVEDAPATTTIINGFRSLDSDCGTDMEMGSNSTNPFRSCQPPSFEEILANSGLRLSDLAVVSIPNSDGGCSDSEAPSESLPPPGNYARHPNLYLPPYSIASETEAEDNVSSRNNNGRHMNGHYTTMAAEDDDDDDSPSSSQSSFASQIHRPLANLRAGMTTATAGSARCDRVSSLMGSSSDVSNLCDIEDSEYEADDVGRMSTTVHKPGQPIQTDV